MTQFSSIRKPFNFNHFSNENIRNIEKAVGEIYHWKDGDYKQVKESGKGMYEKVGANSAKETPTPTYQNGTEVTWTDHEGYTGEGKIISSKFDKGQHLFLVESDGAGAYFTEEQLLPKTYKAEEPQKHDLKVGASILYHKGTGTRLRVIGLPTKSDIIYEVVSVNPDSPIKFSIGEKLKSIRGLIGHTYLLEDENAQVPSMEEKVEAQTPKLGPPFGVDFDGKSYYIKDVEGNKLQGGFNSYQEALIQMAEQKFPETNLLKEKYPNLAFPEIKDSEFVKKEMKDYNLDFIPTKEQVQQATNVSDTKFTIPGEGSTYSFQNEVQFGFPTENFSIIELFNETSLEGQEVMKGTYDQCLEWIEAKVNSTPSTLKDQAINDFYKENSLLANRIKNMPMNPTTESILSKVEHWADRLGYLTEELLYQKLDQTQLDYLNSY